MRQIAFFLSPGSKALRKFSLSVQLAVVALLAVVSVLIFELVGAWPATVMTVVCVYLGASFWFSFRQPLRMLQEQIRALADGDLTKEWEIVGSNELSSMNREMAQTHHQLSQVVARIRSESQLVAMAGERLTRGARELSDRTEAQASNLEQTRAALAQITETVQRNAAEASAADEYARSVRESAEAGRDRMLSSVEAMQRIEAQSRQMANIINVIDGIAFQTNILALNAAVEAARAGDLGRGFSVVASEVRTLAQRSAAAAKEIKQLIEGSSQEVHHGVRTIEHAQDALAKATDGISEVSGRLREVAESSRNQSTGLEEIASAVILLDDITQKNAHMVDRSVQAAESLRSQARMLSDGVSAMRLRQGCADEAKALVEQAVAVAEQYGIAEAIRQITDPNGPFRDRDLYLIIIDRQKIFRAHGILPDAAGKTLLEIVPSLKDDSQVVRGWAMADEGGGWIETQAHHPVTKLMIEKLTYVQSALNGQYIITCSVNRGDGMTKTDGSYR